MVGIQALLQIYKCLNKYEASKDDLKMIIYLKCSAGRNLEGIFYFTNQTKKLLYSDNVILYK